MNLIGGKGKRAAGVFGSLLVSMGVTVVLLLLLAVILLKLQPDLQLAEKGILLVYVLACFAGGWYAGRRSGKRKFLWGLLSGALYFLLLLAVSVLRTQPFECGILESGIAFLLCIGAGMLGGMLA